MPRLRQVPRAEAPADAPIAPEPAPIDWLGLDRLVDELAAPGKGLVMVMGGLVKGTLGVGLPLVAVPLLSLLLPAPQAMGLLVVPVLASNLLQAWQGGRLGFALRRFGPLMLAQLAATLLADPGRGRA